MFFIIATIYYYYYYYYYYYSIIAAKERYLLIGSDGGKVLVDKFIAEQSSVLAKNIQEAKGTFLAIQSIHSIHLSLILFFVGSSLLTRFFLFYLSISTERGTNKIRFAGVMTGKVLRSIVEQLEAHYLIKHNDR